MRLRRAIKSSRLAKTLLLWLVACACLTGLSAETDRNPPGISLEQKLGVQLPMDSVFLDEQGHQIQLATLLDRPLLLVPGYYECPRLCGLVFSSVRDAIRNGREFGLEPGRDYNVVSLSFNPDEKQVQALEKGEIYRKSLALEAAAWRFLRSKQGSAARLLRSAGYNYQPDGRDYSHPAALIIVTKKGQISRYLDGFDIASRDFRFALIEASGGRIGNPIDRAFQLCFRWDNAQGRYAPVAWAFIRIGGAIMLLTLIGLILFLRRSERKT